LKPYHDALDPTEDVRAWVHGYVIERSGNKLTIEYTAKRPDGTEKMADGARLYMTGASGEELLVMVIPLTSAEAPDKEVPPPADEVVTETPTVDDLVAQASEDVE
jgi:hypothetical protein